MKHTTLILSLMLLFTFGTTFLHSVAAQTVRNQQRTTSLPRISKADSSWIQIVDPRNVRIDEVHVVGVIPLADSRQIAQMQPSKFHEAVFSEIYAAVQETLGRPGAMVTTMDVTVYGAPIGNYRKNEQNALTRATELKHYLMGDYDKEGAPSSVNVQWVAEDWDSIATLIERSDIRFRNAALDIIKNVSVGAGREHQLQIIGNGSLYSQLREEVFPRVCRLEYDLVLRIPVEGLSVSPREASLEQLFVTAMRFSKESTEFCDLMDISERVYPMSTVAAINAAATALIRGNLSRAEHCLKGLQTLPYAYNNIGVFYMLKGDREKALVYLKMAEAQGVPEAKRVLAVLDE